MKVQGPGKSHVGQFRLDNKIGENDYEGDEEGERLPWLLLAEIIYLSHGTNACTSFYHRKKTNECSVKELGLPYMTLSDLVSAAWLCVCECESQNQRWSGRTEKTVRPNPRWLMLQWTHHLCCFLRNTGRFRTVSDDAILYGSKAIDPGWFMVAERDPIERGICWFAPKLAHSLRKTRAHTWTAIHYTHTDNSVDRHTGVQRAASWLRSLRILVNRQ